MAVLFRGGGIKAVPLRKKNSTAIKLKGGRGLRPLKKNLFCSFPKACKNMAVVELAVSFYKVPETHDYV